MTTAGLLVWALIIAVTVVLSRRAARAARALIRTNRQVNADIAFMRAIPGGE